MISEVPEGRRSSRPGVSIFILFLGVSLIGLLAFGLVKQSPDQSIDDALQTGGSKLAPALRLPVLDRGAAPSPLRSVVERVAADDSISLRELRGTPVVLNFWASWCDPCRRESPVLQRGWSFASTRGVLFLGIDQQDNRPDARSFLEKYSITYPNVREAGSETSRRYGTTGYPETFFVSARGQVVAHVIGEISADQLRAGIAAAQQGKPRQLGAGGDRRTGQ